MEISGVQSRHAAQAKAERLEARAADQARIDEETKKAIQAIQAQQQQQVQQPKPDLSQGQTFSVYA